MRGSPQGQFGQYRPLLLNRLAQLPVISRVCTVQSAAHDRECPSLPGQGTSMGSRIDPTSQPADDGKSQGRQIRRQFLGERPTYRADLPCSDNRHGPPVAFLQRTLDVEQRGWIRNSF